MSWNEGIKVGLEMVSLIVTILLSAAKIINRMDDRFERLHDLVQAGAATQQVHAEKLAQLKESDERLQSSLSTHMEKTNQQLVALDMRVTVLATEAKLQHTPPPIRIGDHQGD